MSVTSCSISCHELNMEANQAELELSWIIRFSKVGRNPKLIVIRLSPWVAAVKAPNSCREDHSQNSKRAKQCFLRKMAHHSRPRESLFPPLLPFIIFFTSSAIFSSFQQFLTLQPEMDISEIAKRLGLSDSKQLVRKAAEIRRLCDVQFDSSVIGVGEVCKAVMCLEIAATRFQVIFDRKMGMKLSGMSEKAYTRSFNLLQNSIGVKYKDRFLASLPDSRRSSADFTRPVFTAVAFYLSAKKQKLKIDKDKLIEVCGTSESEFLSVVTSMKDICFDVFGVTKEKTDPKEVKCNRDLLDVLPEKRTVEDGGYISDGGAEVSSYKKRKRTEKQGYEKWKSTVMASNKKNNSKGSFWFFISYLGFPRSN
ncbi:Origin of replication complex subunit 6 [Linum perenne]